jgi:hypothetical protein
MERTTK